MKTALEEFLVVESQDMKILIAEDQAPSAFTSAARSKKWATRPPSHPTASRPGGSCRAAMLPLLISDWMMPLLDGPAALPAHPLRPRRNDIRTSSS